MNYLRAQVNFRQLRAETAGNRYLRRFLPASAGIFTCGSVYLRPSQVILHAPVLQCGFALEMKSVNVLPRGPTPRSSVWMHTGKRCWMSGRKEWSLEEQRETWREVRRIKSSLKNSPKITRTFNTKRKWLVQISEASETSRSFWWN